MADKELFTVRKEFVERAKRDLILQLLDDLLEDGVVNDGERKFVVEQYPVTADKARCLIDKVRYKSPKASQRLIDRLRERDPALCEHLNVRPVFKPGPVPTVTVPQQETREGLRICTEEFKRHVLEKDAGSIYLPKEKGQRKRWALLINNINFDLKSMVRHGAEKDGEDMENLLKALDYSVEKHLDLSAKDMDEKIKKFSEREEHAQSDSTFVVIMSHGKRDFICGKHFDPDHTEGKSDLFKIDNIFTHLNNKNCPGLRGKPKIILIQACRGEGSGAVWVSDGIPEPRPLEGDGIKKEHRETDFGCLLPCTPDTEAYRDDMQGTIFIQAFVETINNHAHEDHMMELFRKVMKKCEKCKLQMPTADRTTLLNKFYLFPGL